MDLLCVEKLTDCRIADRDQVIFGDLRVLHNLLDMELVYVPPCNYFTLVQHDIQPYQRKIVATWMLEVCEELHCEEQVYPLSVNFLDRFLCACVISRTQLQLVAAVCLLLSSKIRQCHALSVDLLCVYCDDSFTPDELRKWELLVLSKLEWNVTAVTGFDFVDHVLARVPWSADNPLIRRHAHTLVALCYTEPEFIESAPSLLATASICAAVRGMNLPSAGAALAVVCQLTRVSLSAAERVVRHIERIVESEAAALESQQNAALAAATAAAAAAAAATAAAVHAATGPALGQTCAAAAGKMGDDARLPETPTDVADVHF